MLTKTPVPKQAAQGVTVEDVQRILDLGALLQAALTEDELRALAECLRVKIGNARDT